MGTTALLPPKTAVRMVWALTGEFSDDQHSKDEAASVEESLKIVQAASSAGSPGDKKYVPSAIALMRASLRTIDIAYKGRELNFHENEKLRESSLESVKENQDVGIKLKDFITTLPTMTLSGAGGATIMQIFGISGILLGAATLATATIGFCIHYWILKSNRSKTQMLYVLQDYERDLYYEQYIERVKSVLLDLLHNLQALHQAIFLVPCEAKSVDSDEKTIKSILVGAQETNCEYLHECMAEKKITAELWARCDSGINNVRCEFFIEKNRARQNHHENAPAGR